VLNSNCNEFISMLASKQPVPGGGGASAYAGALGIALGSMVGNLTIGKKKYESVENEMKDLIRSSYLLQKEFSDLVDQDAEAFRPLAAAYGLPAGSDDEKAVKEATMQAALTDAALVPLAIAECAVKALHLLEQYALKGSRLVISDAGVGALFCKAALQGAKLNVLINLKLMKDQELKNNITKRLAVAEQEGVGLADRIYSYVEGEL
jgi:methenyltetrahydrofolate cyclohydrolase